MKRSSEDTLVGPAKKACSSEPRFKRKWEQFTKPGKDYFLVLTTDRRDYDQPCRHYLSVCPKTSGGSMQIYLGEEGPFLYKEDKGEWATTVKMHYMYKSKAKRIDKGLFDMINRSEGPADEVYEALKAIPAVLLSKTIWSSNITSILVLGWNHMKPLAAGRCSARFSPLTTLTIDVPSY